MEVGFNGEVHEEVTIARTHQYDPRLQYGGAYSGDSKDTESFKYINFTSLPAFTLRHKSFVSKNLTVELFEKLKNFKTSKDYTFSNAIMVGVLAPHVLLGISAGDEECWELFKEIYHPAIKSRHENFTETHKQLRNLNPSELKISDEQALLFNQYVKSTRIRTSRNLSGFSYPPGTTVAERESVESTLRSIFTEFTGEFEGKYYQLGSLSPDQVANLQQEGKLFQTPTEGSLITCCGGARSWPDNRGLYLNSSETAVFWANEEDHCRLISMEQGGDFNSVFSRFCRLCCEFDVIAERNNVRVSWSDNLGFLSSCPSNLGTALRASVIISLPGFDRVADGAERDERNLLEDVCEGLKLQIRGSAGEFTNSVEAKYDISNKQRLGFSEVELVQTVVNGVTTIIQMERMLESGATHHEIRALLQQKLAEMA